MLLIPQMNNQLESIHYAVNWWMTLFTGATELPFNYIVRIMDTFLYEKQKILYRISLTILKIKEKELLTKKDLCSMLPLINKEFEGPIWEDEDAFFKIAFGIHFTRSQIKVKSKFSRNPDVFFFWLSRNYRIKSW